MERAQRRNPILAWLTTSALLTGAVALGWVANEAGLNQALYAAGWPLLVGFLALAAFYVLVLPFWKHLPRWRLPGWLGWLDRWSGPALGLFGITLSASAMFSNGDFYFAFFGVLLGALLVIELWRWRRERTDAAKDDTQQS